MKLIKRIYEKKNSKPAPYYYDYDIGTILTKPFRKWVTNSIAPGCPFNCIRIALHGKNQGHNRIKIENGVYVGMCSDVIGKNRENGGYYNRERFHRWSWQSSECGCSNRKNHSGDTCENSTSKYCNRLFEEVTA